MKISFKVIRLIIGVISTIVLLVLTYTIGDNLINNTVSISNSIILPLSLLAYVFVGYDLFLELIENFKEKSFFNEILLTFIATIAAFCIGEYVEALAIMVFFQIGEEFEHYAIHKSKSTIKSILKLRPEFVRLVKDEKIIKPEDAKIDDVFLVNPGEKVPLDGVIVKGASTLDYSSMTGESLPVEKQKGDEVLSGVLNLSSPLAIKATREYSNSTVAKILDLVENVEKNKATPEKFIRRFAKIYTPIVVVLAFLVAIIPPLFIGINDATVWMGWVKTGATFLVISCPCALVLSVPMSYFIGLGIASKNKILIKGSTYLELMDKTKVLMFDKTGTITKGTFEVTDIILAKNSNKDELLKLATYAEAFSNHPISISIKNYSKMDIDKSRLSNYKEIPGQGVVTKYLDKQLLAGNIKLMNQYKIKFDECTNIGTNIYIAYDNKYIGCLTIKDVIKPSAKLALANLKKEGITQTCMLTGDSKSIALEIAKECGIDSVQYELLPLQKAEIIEKFLAESNQKVAFIGDGVNDSPSLTIADVGISMGQIGSDAAIESSNIVIMDDDLNRLSILKRISRFTNINVIENIFISIGFKVAILILSLVSSFVDFGLSNYILWFAIFSDVGVSVLCCLNAFRLVLKKFKK